MVDPRPSGIPVHYGSWAAMMEEALTAVSMSDNVMITAESIATRYTHPSVRYLPLVDVPYCQVDLCTARQTGAPPSGRSASPRSIRYPPRANYPALHSGRSWTAAVGGPLSDVSTLTSRRLSSAPPGTEG